LFYHVWGWFIDLSSSRGQGGLTYAEIQAWSTLTGIQPTSEEMELLRGVDQAYLKQQANER